MVAPQEIAKSRTDELGSPVQAQGLQKPAKRGGYSLIAFKLRCLGTVVGLEAGFEQFQFEGEERGPADEAELGFGDYLSCDGPRRPSSPRR
jgi:hypothetical protein